MRKEIEAKLVMEKHIYDIPLRVLIYKEDGEFVAHALEMDLLGCGATHKEAMSELLEAILCQISFAHQKKDPSLLLHPAAPELFERWEKARVAELRSEVFADRSLKMKPLAVCLPIPRHDIKQAIARKSRFTPVLEDCAKAA